MIIAVDPKCSDILVLTAHHLVDVYRLGMFDRALREDGHGCRTELAWGYDDEGRETSACMKIRVDVLVNIMIGID